MDPRLSRSSLSWPPEAVQPTWMTDAVRGVRAGLLLGVSPQWFVKPGGESIRR